jgi:hypothetical protein
MAKYSQKTHCCYYRSFVLFPAGARQKFDRWSDVTGASVYPIMSCPPEPESRPFFFEKPITRFLNWTRLVATRTLSSLAIVHVRFKIPQKIALQIPQSNQEAAAVEKRLKCWIHIFLCLHLNFSTITKRGREKCKTTRDVVRIDNPNSGRKFSFQNCVGLAQTMPSFRAESAVCVCNTIASQLTHCTLQTRLLFY